MKSTTEKTADWLLDFGFSFLLTFHILRYSKEKNIPVSEIIKLFKNQNIPLESASYISFNGYEAFVRLVDLCQND